MHNWQIKLTEYNSIVKYQQFNCILERLIHGIYVRALIFLTALIFLITINSLTR